MFGKIELVMLTKKRIPPLCLMLIGELIIESKLMIMYLELMLNSMKDFFEQATSSIGQDCSWSLLLTLHLVVIVFSRIQHIPFHSMTPRYRLMKLVKKCIVSGSRLVL